MSIERDENYVPRTRSDFNLPPQSTAHISDYHDIFEETPICTLCRMLVMQAVGWHYYLLTNAMGSPMYPPGTNVSGGSSAPPSYALTVFLRYQHLQPSSPLFKPHERPGIIASNIGLTAMTSILYFWTRQVGVHNFFKLYFVPYIVSCYLYLRSHTQHSRYLDLARESLDSYVNLPPPQRPNNSSLPKKAVVLPSGSHFNSG